MNRIYLLLMPLCALLSCSNDKILSAPKELNLSISQAISPVKVFIGDTVNINLVATINDDNIKRIEILEVPKDVNDLRNKLRFTLIDNTTPLTMDKDGYLSRKISSLMMVHPIIINKDATLMGKILQVKYRVTSESGDQKTVTAGILITKYINNTMMPVFVLAEAQKGLFFDPVENKIYDRTTYKENIDKIEMAIYADAAKKYHVLNPASEEAEKIMQGFGITGYKASEMRATKFEAKNSVNYYLITDVELDDITLGKPVDKVSMITDNVNYYVTQDQKTGCMRAKITGGNFLVATKMQGIIR